MLRQLEETCHLLELTLGSFGERLWVYGEYGNRTNQLTGLSWFIMVYHGLYWFIMVYHGLSWLVGFYIP
jgi:hypothetical protein